MTRARGKLFGAIVVMGAAITAPACDQGKPPVPPPSPEPPRPPPADASPTPDAPIDAIAEVDAGIDKLPVDRVMIL